MTSVFLNVKILIYCTNTNRTEQTGGFDLNDISILHPIATLSIVYDNDKHFQSLINLDVLIFNNNTNYYVVGEEMINHAVKIGLRVFHENKKLSNDNFYSSILSQLHNSKTASHLDLNNLTSEILRNSLIDFIDKNCESIQLIKSHKNSFNNDEEWKKYLNDHKRGSVADIRFCQFIALFLDINILLVTTGNNKAVPFYSLNFNSKSGCSVMIASHKGFFYSLLKKDELDEANEIDFNVDFVLKSDKSNKRTH